MGWILGRRRERRLAVLDEFRQLRRVADEDVTVFGEQLAELHVDMLTTELDRDMRSDYQVALDHYERAKAALARAGDAAAVRGVDPVLEAGRFHLACVLARRDGDDLPQRRDSCFFNPQHGPAVTDLAWTPPGGVERRVPVCGADARRLEVGEPPDVRLVRVGDRFVPWFQVERERGLLLASFGPMAVGGVPKYVMLEADINRTRNNTPGGGSGL
jgi:hypothetical protein